MASTTHHPHRPPSTEAIWHEFGEELRAFVHRRIADHDRAEDVVSEILLRVHEHLDGVTDHRRLVGWLYQVARNAIADEYRRHARRPVPIESTTLEGELDHSCEHADSWIDDPRRVEQVLAASVRPLLDALAPHYRRALELTDLGPHTQTEAARIEGVSISGMKTRVQRGRQQLAQVFHRRCLLTLDANGAPIDCGPRPPYLCAPRRADSLILGG